MQKLKRANLLFCLVFSFIFLFGNVFSVQAGTAREEQKLKQCIDQKDYPNEIVECAVDYTVQSIRNNGEKKIIWNINNMEFLIKEKPWYKLESSYEFDNAYAEIHKNKDFALIHVSVYRAKFWGGKEKFNLTFELKVN